MAAAATTTSTTTSTTVSSPVTTSNSYNNQSHVAVTVDDANDCSNSRIMCIVALSCIIIGAALLNIGGANTFSVYNTIYGYTHRVPAVVYHLDIHDYLPECTYFLKYTDIRNFRNYTGSVHDKRNCQGMLEALYNGFIINFNTDEPENNYVEDRRDKTFNLMSKLSNAFIAIGWGIIVLTSVFVVVFIS